VHSGDGAVAEDAGVKSHAQRSGDELVEVFAARGEDRYGRILATCSSLWGARVADSVGPESG
jgi:endonuclease YncB( thermonuclease family)